MSKSKWHGIFNQQCQKKRGKSSQRWTTTKRGNFGMGVNLDLRGATNEANF